jgi:O-antigen/teichoic acid export membrane protein
MTSLRRQIMTEGGWVLAGYVATTAASLVGLRLLTGFLAPDVFGTVNLLLGVLMLGQHVFIAPFQQAAFRFYSESQRESDLPRLRRIVAGYMRRAAALLLVLLLAGGLGFSAWSDTPYASFVVLGGMLLVQVIRSFEGSFLWAARRQRPIALLQAADACAKPLLAIAAVVLSRPSPEAVLLGYLLSEVMVVGALFALVPREGRGRGAPSASADAELAREIRSYAWPLSPVALANWISNLSSRYILGSIVGPAGVGLYAASYGLTAQPFITAQSVTGQTLSPHYFNAISSNDAALARKAFAAWFLGTLGLCAVGVVAILLLRDWIAWLFLAEEYRAGTALMAWIALGNSIFALSQVLTLRLQAQKRTKPVMIAYIAGAVAAIGVTVPLTWSFGVVGAAIACPCYYGIQFAALALFGSRQDSARK